MSGAPDPAYIAARRVLLDALTALRLHLDSIILVGAQAVYTHTGETELAVAPYTTDGDLAFDVESLRGEPLLETVMTEAGFERVEPGSWMSPSNVSIDLMVPEAQGGGGKRAARIPPHHRHVARKAFGLEAALVDRDLQVINALERSDTRSFEIQVAGPAALVMAKVIKIDERRNDLDRLSDKDALDVFRLLRAVETQTIAERMVRIESDERANAVAMRANTLIPDLFGSPRALGCQMAVRAMEGLMDEDEITASLTLLTADLLSTVKSLRKT